MTKISRQTWLYVLMVILLAVVLVQGWFLYDLKRSVNSLSVTEDTQTLSGQLPNTAYQFKSDNLNQWDPFKEMQRLQDEIDQAFGRSFGRFDSNPAFESLFSQNGFHPKIDMRETKDAYVVHVDVPGADEHNLNVSIEDQQLTISGSIEKQQESESSNQLFRERRSGHFSRSISLSEPVDASKMKTNYNNGVLEIVIPKANA